MSVEILFHRSVINSFIYLFTYLLIYLSVDSFIQSFIHLFIYLPFDFKIVVGTAYAYQWKQ